MMRITDFVELLKYNGFICVDAVHYTYCNDEFLFMRGDNHYKTTFCLGKLKPNGDIINQFVTYRIAENIGFEDAIEFAKIKGLELKPVPKFRPHWKITINGEDTGKVIYADEIVMEVGTYDYYDIKDKLNLDESIEFITTNNDCDIYENDETNFAYYKDNILHEAVWIGEEK